MRWRTVALALVPGLVLFSAVGALGQRARGAFEGEGRVLAVDEAKSTVTLDHGPIPGLMPPMRMRFTVDGTEQLRDVKPGDRVRFSIGSRGDEMVVVTIEPEPAAAPDRR
jgi:Cu/Ag efflux protein CusF